MGVCRRDEIARCTSSSSEELDGEAEDDGEGLLHDDQHVKV